MTTRKRFNRVMLKAILLMGCAGLVLLSGVAAYGRPHNMSKATADLQELLQSGDAATPDQSFQHAVHDMLKLLLAAALGLIIALVHKRTMKVRAINVSLEQAEILLCVAGALMVIIIGNSLARAFGLVGAASFIRFRTPVKDPKDTVVLFLLVSLGMSCGLGIFTIAMLGTLILVIFLWLVHLFGSKEDNERLLLLEVVADDFKKPHALIQKILTKNNVNYEVIKIKKEEGSILQYELSLTDAQSIEDLSDQILASDTGTIKSINWEVRQKQ